MLLGLAKLPKGVVSKSLPFKDPDATFLLKRLFSLGFTHVTTRFLQVHGLGRYFYNVNVDDYQLVCRRGSIQ